MATPPSMTVGVVLVRLDRKGLPALPILTTTSEEDGGSPSELVGDVGGEWQTGDRNKDEHVNLGHGQKARSVLLTLRYLRYSGWR